MWVLLRELLRVVGNTVQLLVFGDPKRSLNIDKDILSPERHVCMHMGRGGSSPKDQEIVLMKIKQLTLVWLTLEMAVGLDSLEAWYIVNYYMPRTTRDCVHQMNTAKRPGFLVLVMKTRALLRI